MKKQQFIRTLYKVDRLKHTLTINNKKYKYLAFSVFDNYIQIYKTKEIIIVKF